jgi:hypothetical protein
MLAFRTMALQSQADRRMLAIAIVCFSAGHIGYSLIRNRVYAPLFEIDPFSLDAFHFVWNLGILQSLVFLLAVYIPALVYFTGLISGDAFGFPRFRRGYRLYLSALLPLYGAVFMATAPIQWIIPHFLNVGILDVSLGYLIRSILLSVYTVWGLKHLAGLKGAQACGAFMLTWITFPILYLIYSVSLI